MMTYRRDAISICQRSVGGRHFQSVEEDCCSAEDRTAGARLTPELGYLAKSVASLDVTLLVRLASEND